VSRSEDNVPDKRPGPPAEERRASGGRRAPSPGPRILLRRLREIMAVAGSTDERLARTVKIIAANMVAEVCSVYMLRGHQTLELMATEGLNPEAVHQTRLRVGEGLIGDIAANARPLSLADAQSHPQFAYRPETGEEVYHSLLGVPIMRGGKVIGVLAVQNRTRRNYAEEEIEALETTAMVLAELASSGQMGGEDQVRASRTSLPYRCEGRTLSEGLAIGVAVLHEPRIAVSKTIADDIPKEKERLRAAVASMREAVDEMLATHDLETMGESREVLEAYKMFAHDTGWLNRLHEAVDSGLTAEAAVLRVQTDTHHRMMQVTDPYLRERLADLEDLANRLLQHLSGRAGTAAMENLPDQAVLFARAMGPAELLDYDKARLKAVVLEEGTTMSHVAIVARALNIPVLGGCADIIQHVDSGDQVVVDGDNRQVFLRPGEDALKAFRLNLVARERRLAKYAADRDQPPLTRDGQRIALNMNAGLLVDIPHLEETRADGIGLYRTELHFMVRASFPKVEAQTELYSAVLDGAGDRPVVFRTLDVGGDKPLPYLVEEDEDNPAIGWRAIRISLDRPALLRSQIRALLLAAAGRSLNVMFPMVAEVDEFVRARAVVDSEVGRLRATGRPLPTSIRIGSMIEVPSLAWGLPALLPLVDFVSVGSNDLLQFMFAADRGNARLTDRYDPLSPMVLGFLKEIADRCAAAQVPLNFCGEMAARPLEAMALVGIGYRSLSMPAASIGPVKEMLRSLSVPELATHLQDLLCLPDRSVRQRLRDYAEQAGIAI
jgi:phosphotransferase system enzyme I (PtsP)